MFKRKTTLVDKNLDTAENRSDGKSINWPLIGFGAVFVTIAGVYVLANTEGGIERVSDLIPEANVTPDQRDGGSLLFGDVPPGERAEPRVPEDPRVGVLQAELQALRDQLAALQTAPEPEQPDAAPAPAADPAVDPELLAGLSDELASQKDVLTRLVDAIEKGNEDQERRLRELLARRTATQEPTPEQTVDADRAAREAELERRRQAEAERLASPLMGGGNAGGGNAGGGAGSTGTASNNANATGNGFLDAAANREVQTAYANQLGDVHRLITQGTIIPAILETAIASDLPGQLRARVSRDVWSADMTTVLIPKGSTLVGEYSSNIQLGQSRVLVAWNRVITTDQRSVMIGSRGVDALGRAGFAGDVDHHFGLKFETAFFVSIFSAIGNIGSGGNGRYASSIEEGTETMQDVGESVLDQYLSIPPTVHVHQGADVNVFVSRDLYL